ncbi:PREDICTED: aberrant root formation protein 4 isoform X2 [Tarenaya hassleriana]|uniref:aberrant root formation protein 4 isoform X2 n=1 Tax=Tarenaya hassleriana TaxID=28532 RepID=UPI0008FD34DC|nr:PREDICTED: aberrant root formation protein 4 isoform X2 [Tarenaya hassleriana]
MFLGVSMSCRFAKSIINCLLFKIVKLEISKFSALASPRVIIAKARAAAAMASPPLGSYGVEKSFGITADIAAPSSQIRELLILCSTAVEAGDVPELENLVAELVNSLNSLYEDVASDPGSTDLENNVFQVLAEILSLLSLPVDQVVMDALSFELPKSISKFANISSRCLETVDNIVDRFVTACSPRDMLSILCEALVAVRGSIGASYCSTPLLHGFSKVIPSIQRRHYEQLKVAVPVVVKILKDISLETEVEVEDLFNKALGVAVSIRDVCPKLKSEENAKLRSLLGLYVLQIMALLSVSIRDKVENCLSLATELAPFLTYCGYTYIGLITGHDTETGMRIIAGDDDDDDDDFINSLSDINLGASLSVIWAKISNNVAQAPHSDLSDVMNELQNNQVKRWQTYGMLKYVISSGYLLWEFRTHAIEFLLDITKEVTPSHGNDEQFDCSQYTPSIYTALQAVTLVIMHAPNANLRKKTFDALKRITNHIQVSK